MKFEDLRLSEPLLRAVRSEGYTTPTPIQVQSIPHVLAGRDLLGCAQTGTGKTAAFALPMIQRLSGSQRPAGAPPHSIRALILSPTRELAAQIGDSFASYGRNSGLRHSVIFGGVGQAPQEAALRRGVDILVATPGRLLDLMNQRVVSLGHIEVLVLDEADRMLDMGFLPDVRRVIAALPKKRQTLLFSATMPDDVRALAQGILIDPVSVAVAPVSSTAERIEQSVYFVAKHYKRALLEHVLRDPAIVRALVFTRTKHGANRVADHLRRAPIAAEVIHGNKAQSARTRALESFRAGTTRVLVATDIAARGIDVDGITHVINFDLPNISESYVHRIGRTARAGASGIAISFCDEEERKYLQDVQKLIALRIPVVSDHPYAGAQPPPSADPLAHEAREPREGRGRRGRSQGQGNGRGSRGDSQGRAPRAESQGRGGQAQARGGQPQGLRRDDGQGRGRDGQGRGGERSSWSPEPRAPQGPRAEAPRPSTPSIAVVGSPRPPSTGGGSLGGRSGVRSFRPKRRGFSA